MQYVTFTVKNFKGIKNTRIDLGSRANAKIFTLVGLNESGKTTLLEAIHSFSPDEDNQVIFSDLSFAKVDKADLIPKHRLADFTDTISVRATVVLEPDDLSALTEFVEQKLQPI